MFALQGSDGQTILCCKEVIEQIPYARDWFLPYKEIPPSPLDALPVTHVSTRTLRHLKALLQIHVSQGYVPFNLEAEQRLPTLPINVPAFVRADPWQGHATYLDFFNTLSGKDLVQLFEATDFLCAWDARYGVAYAILQRLFRNDLDIIISLQLASTHLQNILAAIYHRHMQ